MKNTRTLIASLILAAGISGLASAQGNPQGQGNFGCNGMGPMVGMQGQGGQMGPRGMRASMRVDPAQRAEARLTMLKEQLKLTAEQEPLWLAFAEKAKAEAGKGFKAMQNQPADANLTAPERMAKMQALMQERLTAMAGVHENFNRLYEALTPEQKKLADQHAVQMGPKGKGGMRGQGGRMGPPPAAQG
jgi:hypothetical protein